jgi:hypothetical protein
MSHLDTPTGPGPAFWYRLVLRSVFGTETRTPPVSVAVAARAPRTALDAPRQAADGQVQLVYRIGPGALPVRLDVYAVDGRLVRSLQRGVQPAGEHRLDWDARDGGGRSLARGVYWVRLEAGPSVLSRRVLLLRR